MPEPDLLSEVNRMARELADIRRLTTEIIKYIRDAEAECPERIRRFMNYFHDVHDIRYMYEELGQSPPEHINREVERLDDRYRQILSEENAPGGAFDKVRRKMASDPMNRYDHTRQLAAPTHETEKSNGEAGTVGPRGLPAEG